MNKKQYNISKKRLVEVTVKIGKIAAHTEETGLKKELVLASLEDFKNGLEEEISNFELFDNSI